MASPVIVDLRNIYRPDEMIARGFVYHSVGRSESHKRASVLGRAPAGKNSRD